MSDGSNETWGDYHDGSPAKAQQWDEYERAHEFSADAPYPESLRLFLGDRALVVDDLRAFGARWAVQKGKYTLVYAFPDGLKFRTLDTPPKRWSPSGITWEVGKLALGSRPVQGWIMAEGETDTMQLARAYPAWDILCLPNGAKNIPDTLIAQVNDGQPVLVAFDNDKAGMEGAAKVIAALPHAKRMLPPHKDWCASVVADGPLSADPYAYVPAPPEQVKFPVFSVRDIMNTDFGTYAENHWFEDGILPVGGQLIIHAPLKSLKSVIMLDILRAVTTGTPFAGDNGYSYLHAEPASVLLFQMEVRPEAFQRRLLGVIDQVPQQHRDAFIDNFHTYGIADGKLPRMKITQKDFCPTVRGAIEATAAKIIAFDPIQRLTGDADLNQANELDKLLDFFAELQNDGFTVISCHHNNKASGVAAKSANSMTGSQRFGADADTICSVWHDPKIMVPDDNGERKKQRNFSWTQRDGAANGRSIESRPHSANPELMSIKFGPTIREAEDDDTSPSAPSFD